MVFDGVGGQIGGAAFQATASGGRFSAHGAPSGGFAEFDAREAERRGVTVRGINDVRFAPGDAKLLAERALAETAAGRLKPVTGTPSRWKRPPTHTPRSKPATSSGRSCC
jgi:NADPH2:quinone reductase